MYCAVAAFAQRLQVLQPIIAPFAERYQVVAIERAIGGGAFLAGKLIAAKGQLADAAVGAAPGGPAASVGAESMDVGLRNKGVVAVLIIAPFHCSLLLTVLL